MRRRIVAVSCESSVYLLYYKRSDYKSRKRHFMANQKHIEWLLKGVNAWNERREREDFQPDFEGADISGAFKKMGALGNDGRAYLRGINLSGADLSRADLSGADLSRADLSRADLSGADLSRAKLCKAHLIEADLTEAELDRANLSSANLTRAILTNADLRKANLIGANLSRSQPWKARLYG